MTPDMRLPYPRASGVFLSDGESGESVRKEETPEERRARILALTGFVPPSEDEWVPDADPEGTPDSEGSVPSVPVTDTLLAWMHASGALPHIMAQESGLSDYAVTLALSRTSVLSHSKRIKEEYWGHSLVKQFDKAAPAALEFFLDIVEERIPAKVSERLDAAKWLLEKSTGKPKQEVEVTDGHSIRQLFAELEALKSSREAGSLSLEDTALDVSPRELDPLEQWVADNVPVLPGEKT